MLQPLVEPGQYTSAEFAELCEQLGVVQSMGATGVCWDNAAAESFFGTLKRELAHKRTWATRADPTCQYECRSVEWPYSMRAGR